MLVDGRWRQTIEPSADGARVRVLDQTRLPHAIAWLDLADADAVAHAIRTMIVRGAPLIGVAAAYGAALALRADPATYATARATLHATRPTAVNLAWALAEIDRAIADVAPGARADAAWAAADRLREDDAARCSAIGEHGLALLRARAAERGGAPLRVLTHCNAGWLATVDWGTALAPIYKAHDAGLPIEVWVDETRPRNQGALTAWELAQHGVACTLIADNAGGHYLARGEVDLVIVGTDRTTRAGDVCNKIGTYLKAAAARDAGVPFYAAVPSPSIDWTIADARAIAIEERDGDEVRFAVGRDAHGALARVAIAPPDPRVRIANPAFDVTPARLVTGLVTERGVVRAAAPELAALFPELAGGAA